MPAATVTGYIDQVEVAARSNSSGPLAKRTSALAESEILPHSFELEQNYPNPFNPSTTIAFSLPEPSSVSIEIYNIAGSLIVTLLNENRPAGNYQIAWHGRNDSGTQVSSGLYLYRMVAGRFVKARRMVMLK